MMKNLVQRTLGVLTPVAAAPALALASACSAGITAFVDDQSGFLTASGPTTAIDFVSPPGGPGPIAANTYASVGLTLSATYPNPTFFSITNLDGSYGFVDGWGMGTFADAVLALNFAQPISAFGYERYFTAGAFLTCSFYLNGAQVGSTGLNMPGPGSPKFIGWNTTFQFDRVVLNTSYVDNIYFGVVPAPSVVALFGLAGCRSGRRRR